MVETNIPTAWVHYEYHQRDREPMRAQESSSATISEAADIARSVVAVARLGEVDHRGWWGTRSFGPAGRVVLKQRLPRTWRMAAIELNIAAAMNRHNEIIDRPSAVHLFSDNWPVRRWATAWVAEQKTTTPADWIFEMLERCSPDETFSLLTNHNSAQPKPIGNAVRVGSVSVADLISSDRLQLAAPVAELAAAYAGLGTTFAVPYLEVKGEG